MLGALRSAGVAAEPLVFERRSGLDATPEAVERARAELADGRVPVAVGAGVITDVVRYAAHTLGRDFVSVPTAASMDGYASSVAPLMLDGVKVTYPARSPRAIFADPRVVAAAPAELTRSGLGDLLGKATARVDWLAAHLLYGEPFSEPAAARMLDALSFATANAESVLAGDPAAVTGLLEGLIESGIAMAIVGSSRPASGCEHHASHFWDLLAARGLRPHAPHGLQVGYATRFAMRLQRFAFGGGVPALERSRGARAARPRSARVARRADAGARSPPLRRSAGSSPTSPTGRRRRPRGRTSAPRSRPRSSASTTSSARSRSPTSRPSPATSRSTTARSARPSGSRTGCAPATRPSTSSRARARWSGRSTRCSTIPDIYGRLARLDSRGRVCKRTHVGRATVLSELEMYKRRGEGAMLKSRWIRTAALAVAVGGLIAACGSSSSSSSSASSSSTSSSTSTPTISATSFTNNFSAMAALAALAAAGQGQDRRDPAGHDELDAVRRVRRAVPEEGGGGRGSAERRT